MAALSHVIPSLFYVIPDLLYVIPSLFYVIPAKAGIQAAAGACSPTSLVSCLPGQTGISTCPV